MLRDGHIHTPYCPHGTKDSLHKYVEKALSLGFKEISFTEHAPLPKGFTDTTPTKDSAIQPEKLNSYFEELAILKKEYKGKIKINTGLEVDFIEGFEQEITEFLNTVGDQLDDAILSVHFLKNNGTYDCLDYSPDLFEEMIGRYGSVEQIYKKYYETVLLSIQSDLGTYKPKRIGHITLVRKFNKKFPANSLFEQEIISILTAVKTQGYELDFNGAGYSKPLCKEPYPAGWIIAEVNRLNIPWIYGSDAHQAKELGQGLDFFIDIKS